MTAPDLFVGVVSYEGSRFAVSQGPEGLASLLGAILRGHEVSVAVRVNTQDFHRPDDLPVTDELTQGSLSAQLALESRWEDYIRGTDSPTLRVRGARLLRWSRRHWRRIRRPDDRMIRRLINIELSHVDLLRAGLASGAPWILILEDDAAALDPGDCASGIAGLMMSAPASVRFINVSQSFSHEQLGIDRLLHPVAATWAGSVDRLILSASRPVTNTVCAILYRAEFAAELIDTFDRMPMTPVVPIDWKLNEAIMELHAAGRLGEGACWLVSPAPIDQLSMRSATEAS